MAPELQAPGPFSGTAKWYIEYRPPWPPEVIDLVCNRCLSSPGRVLDLGCGPGNLGIAFASRGHSVVGVDAEPEMIHAASELAPEVKWLCTRAEDISFPNSTFHLVVMGRSFHWMDRKLILSRLACWLETNGTIALISDPTTVAPENAWLNAAEDVITRWNPWVGEYETSASARQFITESPFAIVEEVRLPTTRTWTFEDFVGLARSQSKTLPCRQRGEFGTFVNDLRQTLSQFGEPLIEKVEIELLLLKRKP